MIINRTTVENYRRNQLAYKERKIEELKDAKEKDETLETWDMEVFTKANVKELKMLNKDLSIYEKAFLHSIEAYIGYDDCALKYTNGNDLSFDDLVEITGMSRSKLSEVLNDLMKKDIVYKGKNSVNVQYFINPWLFCKGNRINKVLKTMFKNYKIRSLGGVRWKEVK